MTTRSSHQRNNGSQTFQGYVHKWKRGWIVYGNDAAQNSKKKIKLLKWIRTEERALPSKGPRYPYLYPVDKVKSNPGCVQIKPDATKEHTGSEEMSLAKTSSLQTEEIQPDVPRSESTEMLGYGKAHTEPTTERTSVTMDDSTLDRELEMGENTSSDDIDMHD